MASAILKTVSLLALIAMAAGHFNLISPAPYNVIDCNPPDCPGPCPPIWKSGSNKFRNTPATPSGVWKRGERVTIDWLRNSHRGGFYRRSLVPVQHMNNRYWHKKTAFEWGCFTQGQYICGKGKPGCGTDKDGFAYKNQMTVPKVFPDGDYVFSMVWYGGVHFTGKHGYFPNFYTCAYVRIKGGPLAAGYQPKFTRGRNQHYPHVPPGKCSTSKRFISECDGRACMSTPVWFGVPGSFEKGKKPKMIYLKDLNKSLMPTEKVMKTIKMTDEKQKHKDDAAKDMRTDKKLMKEEEALNAAPKRPTGTLDQWRKRYRFCRRDPKCPNCRNGKYPSELSYWLRVGECMSKN